ncbi:hypothetical protein [Dactylosporangium sp. NPDC005555]|uniref:hypothetical protein n=1 Tax=Dactylosporangium sp. NPDC005555 TaxID=3154889 RepID=UPI0033A22A06
MTQPPGPDESTGPAQPSEPVPPAEPGQLRKTAPPEDTAPPAAVSPAAEPPQDGAASEEPAPPAAAVPPQGAAASGGAGGLPGIRPAAPAADGAGPATPYGQQPGYPAQGAYGAAPQGQPQYPMGGYDQSQGYPGVYDPSQAYAIYQAAAPAGGSYPGQIGDGDPLISPDYPGWWRRSTAVVKQGWRQLAVLQFIGFLMSLLFSVPQALLVLDWTKDLPSSGVTVDPETGQAVTPDLGPVLATLGLAFVGGFLAILATFVVAIACNHVAVSVAAGLRPRLGAALGLAVRRVFPLIGWQIVAGLIMLVGLCACIVPVIYLSAVFMLLPVVVTFERGWSAISRCFKLFHRDLGSSISRIATIAGISIGVGVAGFVISSIVQAAGGPSVTLGGQGTVDTRYVVALVVGTALAELIARAAAVLTAPLTLTAYADLRARTEPLTTATLADEAGLRGQPPAPEQQQWAQGQPAPGRQWAPEQQWAPGQPPVQEQQPVQQQQPEQGRDEDWMPPNR